MKADYLIRGGLCPFCSRISLFKWIGKLLGPWEAFLCRRCGAFVVSSFIKEKIYGT